MGNIFSHRDLSRLPLGHTDGLPLGHTDALARHAMGKSTQNHCVCATDFLHVGSRDPLTGFNQQFVDLLSAIPDVTHYAFQLECCDTTGRIHYQTVIRRSKNATFADWHAALSLAGLRGMHFELRKGTYKEAFKYCMDTAKPSYLAGPWSNEPDIPSEELDRPPRAGRFNFVVFGPSKQWCKTTIWKIILSYFGDVYSVPGKAGNSTSRWIGPYRDEPAVLIDEADWDDFPPDMWKQITDRQPTTLPLMAGGKSAAWFPEIVVCITNAKVRTDHPWRGPNFQYRFDEIILWHSNNCVALPPIHKPTKIRYCDSQLDHLFLDSPPKKKKKPL